MDNINKFFRVLYSNPSVMLRFISSLLFVALSLVVFLVPSFGFPSLRARLALGGLILLYGLYRFYTFYNAYKEVRDEMDEKGKL